MTQSQAAHAEAQRQQDALAFRAKVLRERAAELETWLASNGRYDRLMWAAEAATTQAANELAQVKRERAEAAARLATLREQLAALPDRG